MEGWIKLHRKMLDNPIVMKDADHLAVWVYLLLHATHKDYPALFRGMKITLHPGQLITGRKSIASSLCIDEYKVYRILNDLKSEQQIAQQTSNKNSLITILKWELYQDTTQQDAQPMHNNCTTDTQQLHTNKNIRIKEHKNNNSYIYTDEPHSDSPVIVEKPVEKSEMSDEERRTGLKSFVDAKRTDEETKSQTEIWEKRIIEAIKNEDEDRAARFKTMAKRFYDLDIDIDDIRKRVKDDGC